MRHYTNKTVLSDSMFVETGTFVPDVKESGHEVVNICDDDNVGAACAAHLARCCHAMWVHPQQAAAQNSHKLAYNRLTVCILIICDCQIGGCSLCSIPCSLDQPCSWGLGLTLKH